MGCTQKQIKKKGFLNGFNLLSSVGFGLDRFTTYNVGKVISYQIPET